MTIPTENTGEPSSVSFSVQGRPPKKRLDYSPWNKEPAQVKALAQAAKKAMGDRNPFDGDVEIKVRFQRTGKGGDSINFFQGILDVLQGWGRAFQGKQRDYAPKDMSEYERPIMLKNDDRVRKFDYEEWEGEREEYTIIIMSYRRLLLAQSAYKVDLAFEQAVTFYQSHLKELVSKYEGHYIAILDDQVQDHDSDFPRLAQRVYVKFGYRDIFMPKVARGLPRVRFPSPRIVTQPG